MRFPFPAWGELAERLEERGGLGTRTRPTSLSKGKSQNQSQPPSSQAHSLSPPASNECEQAHRASQKQRFSTVRALPKISAMDPRLVQTIAQTS